MGMDHGRLFLNGSDIGIGLGDMAALQESDIPNTDRFVLPANIVFAVPLGVLDVEYHTGLLWHILPHLLCLHKTD